MIKRKLQITILGVVLLLIANTWLFAQDFTISDDLHAFSRSYTTENGLPGNSTTSVIQDQRGFIWISTFNGLVRFDGHRFKIFTSDNVEGLTSNRFIYVTEADDGTIFAGMEHGSMLIIGDDAPEVIEFDRDLYGANISVNSIHKDRSGTLWVGTERALFRLVDGQFQPLDIAIELANPASTQITSDDQYVYFLFASALVRLHIDTEVIEPLLYEDPNSGRVNFMGELTERDASEFGHMWRMVQHEETILIAHDVAVSELSEQGIRHLISRDQLGVFGIQGIMKANETFYIYSTDGLFQTDDFWVEISDIYRLSDQNILHATADHEGGIWLATNANGVTYIKPTPVYMGRRFDVLRGVPVTAILGGTHGSLYVGTNCDGLYHFSQDTHIRYSESDGIQNHCVWSLMKQSNGTLWAGTWGAGAFYKGPDSDRFRPFQPQPMREAAAILSMFEDSQGRVWFGSYYNGVFMKDGDEIVSVLNSNGTQLSGTRTIYETSDGTIYFATDLGIGLLNPDLTVTKPEELNILITTNFRTIQEDSSGRLWFGSYGDGLIIKQEDRIIKLSLEEGLLDNTVSQLQFDHDENLWLAGNNGVFFIEKHHLDSFLDGESDQVTIARLGQGEGLSIRETTGGFMPSSLLNADGQFFVPLVDGLALIETSLKQINENPPKVFLEEVEINGVTFSPDQVGTIAFDDQRIIFRFSVISFINPDYVRAEYMLVGLDQNWQTATDAREAIYTTLPHGTYTLRVRATNNDGIWTEEGLSFTFTVSPPFWLTWWFILLMILLLFLLLYSFYLFRITRIKRINEELEKQVSIRTQELKEVNQELEQLILGKNKMQRVLAHDLRNPLSAIIGYLELLSMDADIEENPDKKQILDMLLDSSRDTLSLLENLLNFSGGTSAIKPAFKNTLLKTVVNDAISITDIQTTQKEITITQTGSPSASAEIDQNMMLSVFRNLISNAIKFSSNGSSITVHIEDNEEVVSVSVMDQGVGMNQEKVENLFNEEPKSSQLGTMGEKGMGIGLQICKEFVQKHQGAIKVESKLQKGSTFIVTLPKVQSKRDN